jgi:DNA-directed RNA polymerase III subunit RPC1
MLQSLEEILNGLLGRLREAAGQAAMKALPWTNTPRIMADCGSKGSPLNISQMIAIVGQQAVGGRRIENGFVDRTLPHFEHNSLTPSAKGFVANAFYSGLTATEFFFHAMGGREGLVDTAVKTAETGYMARRLMKALEDLSMQYDSSVRNSENTVVQFVYGDDGLNPQTMEDNNRPVDFKRVHLQTTEMYPCADERALAPLELISLVEERLSDDRFQRLSAGAVFLQNIRDYFADLARIWNELESERTSGAASMDVRAWNSCRVSPTQLNKILDVGLKKFQVAYVEPGEACGAIGAQSISEPGTQMTLKVCTNACLSVP